MNNDDIVWRRLALARAFIDEHYDLPLDLEQIAGQASFSRYHFLRLFRGAFDQTPHQYLTERRIAKAKELLASSDLSVTEVCLAVRFDSLGSFSALFRRHVGHAPSLPPITAPRELNFWSSAGFGAALHHYYGASP